MIKCAKSSESVTKPEKEWESVSKVEKVWESVLKIEKVFQNMRKLEKVWECEVNDNANANCYLFAYYFWRTVQKSVAIF